MMCGWMPAALEEHGAGLGVFPSKATQELRKQGEDSGPLRVTRTGAQHLCPCCPTGHPGQYFPGAVIPLPSALCPLSPALCPLLSVLLLVIDPSFPGIWEILNCTSANRDGAGIWGIWLMVQLLVNWDLAGGVGTVPWEALRTRTAHAF